MNDDRRIIIFDTTLRDGEQSPGASMNQAEKLRIATQLEALGVDVIEAGFPAASQGDYEAVKAIAQTLKKTQIAALCRATEQDIRRGWDAVKDAVNPRIHTFLATSELHMKYKLQMEPGEVLKQAVESVKLAASFTKNVEFFRRRRISV
jgi:2-isopropylmalate synthase